MANGSTIKIRRSAQAGKVPLTTDLALGELAINTYDGKVFLKKSANNQESIITLEKQLTAGTGVSITSGAINIGQDVSSTISPTFDGITLTDTATINQKGTGTQNSLKVAGAGTGSVFAVGVSSTNSDGINLQSLTSDLTNDAKLTLSGSQILLKITNKQWSFSNNGNIQLPAGGDIVDSTNTSVLKFPTVKRVTFDNPITDSNTNLFYTNVTATHSSNNYITVDDSSGFTEGVPVTFFTPTPNNYGFGNLVVSGVYYIKTIVDSTNITLTTTKNGLEEFVVTDGTGSLIIATMSLSSFQTQRAPRQWTNYDSLETTGYDFSEVTFGDTWYADDLQRIFIFVDTGTGTPQPIDITTV